MPGRTGPVARGLWRVLLGAGPLGRGSDRVELASRLLCAVALLLALPVALTVGTVVAANGVDHARTEAAARHQVVAVLDADAPPHRTGDAGPLSVATPARWEAPDGSGRSGDVRAPRGAVAGDRVTIWVDADGRPTIPPQSAAAARTAGVLSGLGLLLAWVCLALACHLGVCQALEHARSQQWEREWRSVEPGWAGRS